MEVSVSVMPQFGRELKEERGFKNGRLELIIAGTCEGKSTKWRGLELAGW
jgi:hypothetical protein